MATEKKRALDREIAAWLKENHFCVHCRKEPAARGHVLCANCMDYKREYYRQHRDAILEAQKPKRKQYYEKLVAEHKCIRCAKPLESWTPYKTCQKCRVKSRRACKEYSRRKGALPNVLRNSFEYCSICCKPIDKTLKKKICDRCYSNCMKNLEKANQNRNNEYFRGLNNIFWQEKTNSRKVPNA